MLDQSGARELAQRVVPEGLAIDDSSTRELKQGWFFPYRSVGEPCAGSNGVIVNKANGKVFRLGSAFPVERDLEFYDRGYQFERYDLVVLEVRDLHAAVEALLRLNLSVVEPTYEHGTVWRVPRPLSSRELRDLLSKLPCVFGDTTLYFRLEALEAAREAGILRFEALECTGR
jgi:hypothetical protein